MNEITKETTVKASELAVVLGLTGRRVHQLVEDGIITKAARSCFCLADCVQQYIGFISRDNFAEEDIKLDRAKRTADVSYKAARAQIARLEAQELQGKMHRSEDVAAMTEDLVYTIRGMLVALPGRLAVDVAGIETAAEAADLIRKEVFHVLRELSNYRYDPVKYEERVRGRMNWDAITEMEDDSL